MQSAKNQLSWAKKNDLLYKLILKYSLENIWYENIVYFHKYFYKKISQYSIQSSGGMSCGDSSPPIF